MTEAVSFEPLLSIVLLGAVSPGNVIAVNVRVGWSVTAWKVTSTDLPVMTGDVVVMVEPSVNVAVSVYV